MAFAVADELRGRGLGRRLVAMALERAPLVGPTTVEAIMWADNGAMRHLLRDAGFPVVSDHIEAGTEEIELDISSRR